MFKCVYKAVSLFFSILFFRPDDEVKTSNILSKKIKRLHCYQRIGKYFKIFKIILVYRSLINSQPMTKIEKVLSGNITRY